MAKLGILIALMAVTAGCTATGPTISVNTPEQSDSATSASPTGTTPGCPSGIALPAGVDPAQVCGKAPTSTVKLDSFLAPAISDDPFYGFVTADGTVACTWFEAGTVACKGVSMDVDYPSDPKTADAQTDCGQGMYVEDDGAGMVCNGGVLALDQIPDLVTPPTLPDGKIVVSSDYPSTSTAKDAVACVTVDQGLTCWDTATAHGFLLGSEVAVFW